MSNVKYSIQLSADHAPVVTVETDDPTAAKKAIKCAKGVLFFAIEDHQIEGEADDSEVAEVPVCPTHGVAMVRQHGRRGEFWSCHRRNPDGSWCSYRPTAA